METLAYRCRVCGEDFGAPIDFEIDCPACGAGPMYHEEIKEEGTGR